MTGLAVVLAVGVAGGVGAAGRLVLDSAVRARRRRASSLPTLVVNVVGSLLIGVLVGVQHRYGLHADAVLVGAVGFCGGFTTFSTAMAETVRRLQAGEIAGALARAAGHLALTLLAVAVGALLGGGPGALGAG